MSKPLSEHDLIFQHFKRKIEAMKLSIASVDENEGIHIELGDEELVVSLKNIRKAFEVDNNLEPINKLILAIEEYLIFSGIPKWELAKDKVYFQLHDIIYDDQDTIIEPLTPSLVKRYGFDSGLSFLPISETHLEKWGISRNTVLEKANENLNLLLLRSRIERALDEDSKLLAYFETDKEFEHYKASLPFCSKFMVKVAPFFGSPIYCVIPVRDTCHFFSRDDYEYFKDDLRDFVLGEFLERPYPLSTEIIQISELDIKVVHDYRKET